MTTLDQFRKQADRHFRSGRLNEAITAYSSILESVPSDYEAAFQLGKIMIRLGRFEDAHKLLENVLTSNSSQAEAWMYFGIAVQNLGRTDEATASYERAVCLKADFAEAIFFLAILQKNTGLERRALENFNRFIKLHGGTPAAFVHRGDLFRQGGQFSAAMADYESALILNSDFVDGWISRGSLLRKVGKLQDALDSFERAVTLVPDNLQALNNKAVALADLRRLEEALAVYDRILTMTPDSAEGWYNRAAVLQGLGRNGDALISYDRSLIYNPASPFAWNNKGALLRAAGRHGEAQECFERALALNANLDGALANAGMTLQDLKRYTEAAQTFQKLQIVAPDHRYLLAGLLVSAQALCDWATLEELAPRLEDVLSGKAIVPPLTLLGLSSDATLHRAAAAYYLRDQLGSPLPCPRPQPPSHAKIRLAYVSNDFRDHATMTLMIDLFERHDRARFEIIGISFGPPEQTEMQNRIVAAFDQFHDVRDLSDIEIADRMRALGVDIAIDLKGHTEGARPGIFALRPAAVQVNYLGYPGTTASEIMDYVIADPIILPFDRQPFYSENIVHLPDCYQPNDPGRVVGPTPSRATMGLPRHGFVFCCFNNHWKITAPVFGVWMRLLEAVPESVLWLLDDSANTGLQHQAMKHGIDPARLIFAPWLEQAAHLGRLGLADLALDVLPYNSHTTASDLLWTGVPLITVSGETFAGRVAASLLSAIGLPELIAGDLQSYEEMALALARNSEKYRALRRKLAENRLSTSLFDATRFRTAIEAAFIRMHETARRSELPRPFAVGADSGSPAGASPAGA